MPTQWTEEQIPDQPGTVAIVTGANSGIGLETARALAAKNAQVVMACRNLDKGHAALDALCETLPAAQITVMHLNLASLESIHQFASAFQRQFDTLHLLVNNAGVMALPQRRTTADGFEMQFGTNHLGHFALTGMLLDRLLNTPDARVVTVSSGAHVFGKVTFDNLNAEKKYSRWRAYGLSKLANLLFTYELQRLFAAANTDTIAVAAHPGWTSTNLQKHAGVISTLNPFLAQQPAMGALPTLRAAVDPAVSGGDYYGPGGFMSLRGYPVKTQSNGRSHDAVIAQKLWGVSEDLTGVAYTALHGSN